MADQSPDGWLPAGWTVRVHVRRNGKKDKHYYAPSGQRFYSKVEVTRHLKTVKQSPPQGKKEKDATFEESAKDPSSDAVQKDDPKSQEKGKLGLGPSLQNSSPESEEKYYSAEDAVDEGCGSLNSEDNKNAKPDRPAEHCGDPKPGEGKAPAVVAEELTSVEGAKFNLEQPIENCSTPRSEDVNGVNAEESADRICGIARENGSHRPKDEEDVVLEKNKNDACVPVRGGGSPGSKQKKKMRAKQSAKAIQAGVERGVAEGLPDGWIKEVKVTKKKNVVRKDSYYIDPSSGYIFRSMRDALRYLATGDIGRLAFKRKEDDDGGIALEDDKISSPVETKRQKLAENGTNLVYRRSKVTKQHKLDGNQTTTMSGNSVRGAEVTRERAVEPPDTGEAVPDPESHGVSATDLSASDVPKPSGSGKSEERNNTNETDPTPANEAGISRDEPPSATREEMPVLADKAAVLGDELPMEEVEEPASAEVAEGPRVEQPQENTENNLASADENGVPRAEQLLEKTEATTAPADEAEVPQDEQPSQKTEETPGDKATPQATPKSRKKMVPDFPRRTSTRLAGVAIDPGLEVRTARPQRGTVRKLDEGEASGVQSVSARDRSQIQPQTKRTRRGSKSSEPKASVVPSESVPEENAEKLERIQVDDEKKGKSAPSMTQENIFVANRAEKLKADDESVLPFDLPSGDILLDPCIEFAIKTLTGIDFDASQSNSKSSNDFNSSRDAASVKMQTEHMEIEKKVDKKQAPPDKNTLGKASNCEEKVGVENPSSSPSNLPFGDSWQDPCIEFAIKTLTGAIPVEYDLDMNDLMRQQIRSTEFQASSEVAQSNAGIDNFCRTDLLWQHSTGPSSDKAACRQQSGAVPIAQQPSGNNVDLQRAGGAVARQPRQKTQSRGNKYQR